LLSAGPPPIWDRKASIARRSGNLGGVPFVPVADEAGRLRLRLTGMALLSDNGKTGVRPERALVSSCGAAFSCLIAASGKKSSDRNVFIQIRPMDPLSSPDQFPVGALLRGSIEEAREPSQWHRQFPPIVENDTKREFRELNIDG
jgi:hypothetical protein